jgi:D-alanyl-D-alanine carboxypeptidase
VTPGIMVLVDVPGQRTWIEGFGTSDLATKAPISADDHHRVGSVTKTLTGEAILLLVDEGKIGLDDPVEKYLPGVVPNGANITIRQMLDMTSGIYNGTEDPDFMPSYKGQRGFKTRIDRPKT